LATEIPVEQEQDCLPRIHPQSPRRPGREMLAIKKQRAQTKTFSNPMGFLDVRDNDSSAKLTALIAVLSRYVTKMNENDGEADSLASSEASTSNSIDVSMCADAPDIHQERKVKRKRLTNTSSFDTDDESTRETEDNIIDGRSGVCNQFTDSAKSDNSQATPSAGLESPKWKKCVISVVCRHGLQNSQCKECGNSLTSHCRHKVIFPFNLGNVFLLHFLFQLHLHHFPLSFHIPVLPYFPLPLFSYPTTPNPFAPSPLPSSSGVRVDTRGGLSSDGSAAQNAGRRAIGEEHDGSRLCARTRAL
jgi:hypothetical protein